MRVLVIEDDSASADMLGSTLEQNKVKAECAVMPKWKECADEVCSRLRRVQSESESYFAVILDINFKDHYLGGFRIYNKLMVEGLRGRFRHLLIHTNYKTVHSGVPTMEYLAVEAFRELALVPQQNIFRKGREVDRQLIVERLNALSLEKSTHVLVADIWKFF